MCDKKYWDIRGRSFPGYRSGDEFQARVLETIRRHGVDLSDAHVLDLGCGAGSYAVPFAQAARLVTALDISPVMLDRLRSQAAALCITNIRYAECDWAEYKVNEKFDIVFCSRSPAIRDPADLRKACSALSGWGILLHFSGEARASDTHTLGSALLELHGVARKTKTDYSVLQDWLRDANIPFTVYPLQGERRAYFTPEEMTTNAITVVEAAGAAPDAHIIREYLEQFRDEASGKYLSITRYDMELVIWRGQG
ncbi:MAG: class I SAM-dependent methyltransferase [Spirochaetota bacterium]|jgi:SAM-dependent methyltransferase|nr:class I SAM-dependent methyltransferase [Spirochaetota bacterium]